MRSSRKSRLQIIDLFILNKLIIKAETTTMVLRKYWCIKFVTRLVRQPTAQYGDCMYTGMDFLCCIKNQIFVLTTVHNLQTRMQLYLYYLLYNSTENASKRMKLSDIFNGNANGRNGNIQRALTRRNANNATIKFKYNQKKTIKVSHL